MAARLATGPVYESTGLESQDMDSNMDFGGGRGKLLLLLLLLLIAATATASAWEGSVQPKAPPIFVLAYQKSRRVLDCFLEHQLPAKPPRQFVARRSGALVYALWGIE